jgi:hypothetical protein
MPGSDFFTDEQGYKCFVRICLDISKLGFPLLTRPDCSRSQAWQEVDFVTHRHDLGTWLDHMQDATEGNFGTLARIVISNRKTFEASMESLKVSLQLERMIRQRDIRRFEKLRRDDIRRVKKLFRAKLRRERVTRISQIRELKDRYCRSRKDKRCPSHARR